MSHLIPAHFPTARERCRASTWIPGTSTGPWVREDASEAINQSLIPSSPGLRLYALFSVTLLSVFHSLLVWNEAAMCCAIVYRWYVI